MGYIIHNLKEGWYATLLPNAFIEKTLDRQKAHMWETEKKVRNVIKHNFKKDKDTVFEKVNTVEESCPYLVEEESVIIDYSLDDILDMAQGLGTAINQKMSILKETLSYCDRREQDLLHEAESSKYNVCEGYKYYKRLQDLRKERRKVKNEMKKIENLNMMGITKNNIDKALRSAEKVGTVVRYTPRTCEEERERYGV